MKNRRKKKIDVKLIVLIISIFLLAVYAFFYFKFLKDEKKLLYIIPFDALVFFVAFLIGLLITNTKMKNRYRNLLDEYRSEKEKFRNYCGDYQNIAENSPFGTLFYGIDGDINNDSSYYIKSANDAASAIFQVPSLENRKLAYVSSSLLDFIKSEKDETTLEIYGRYFEVIHVKKYNLLHFFDKTQEKYSIDKYESSRISIVTLSIDNMDDELDGMDLRRKTEVMGKYYEVIDKWKNNFNMLGLGEANKVQKFIIKKWDLEKMIKEEFAILHEIEKISKDEEVQISLSIGVGTNADSFKTLAYYADEAYDLAQNRGGGQAVVFDGASSKSYGGKTPYAERTTNVTIKNFASNLLKVIKESTSVIIMPHNDTDADAIGGALGIAHIAEQFGITAKILIDRVDETVQKILNNAATEYININQKIIHESDIDSYSLGTPLLIICDHHEEKLSPSKEVYKKIKRIAVIDHHRLTEALEFTAEVQLMDHLASSTVEIVAEMSKLLPVEIKFPKYLATVMLVGMIIDTNNFSQHTTDRTFSAASVLLSNDADPTKAKLFIRKSLKSEEERIELLRKATIEHDKFAISIDTSEKTERDKLAIVAESLLSMDGIVAGFAMGRLDKNTIAISGRSVGDFNIHIQMEKLGGGGHYNQGGAQIRDKSFEEIKAELIKNLEETINDQEDQMKIILKEDVKGKGKKNDIIDVATGFATHLLRSKKAIEANSANLAALEAEKENERRKEKEEKDVALKLKEKLSDICVKVFVKVGENGKFFGSISTKQIADALQLLDIVVDKKCISLPDEKITSLGTYECIAKVHKEVTAKFKIDVVEGAE